MNPIYVNLAFLAALEMYREFYQKPHDWVPTALDIANARSENAKMTTAEYERQAAERLGLPRLPAPNI